jgi:hypothetical protein
MFTNKAVELVLVYNKKLLLKPNVRPRVAIGETEPI